MSEVGTSLFVVRCSGDIDRVVKPERRLHLVWAARQVSAPVELGQTILNVRRGVIDTGGFGVCGDELLKYLEPVRMSAQAGPKSQPPRLVEGNQHLRHCFTELRLVESLSPGGWRTMRFRFPDARFVQPSPPGPLPIRDLR